MRIFTGLAIFGAVMSLSLFGVRAVSVISFSEPMQVHTTGDEFTNFFYIWKYVQGLPVYNNRFDSPYSATVYNWLFYYSYGIFTKVILGIFSLKDAWLPTVSRFFTLMAIVSSVVASYVAFVRASRAQDRTDKVMCLAFAVFLMFGPLIGFWALTVRADFWAMFFEIIGTVLFLSHYPRRRFSAVIFLIIAVYLAWSFKQGNVFSAGGAGLLLLVRRDWKPLLLLVTVLPAAWGITFLVGDSLWAHVILMSDYPFFFSVERMLRNIANFGVKTGPILLFLAGLAAVVIKSRGRMVMLWRNDTFVLGAGAALLATVVSIPASAQHGGAENYFFTISYFLCLMMMASLPILRMEGGSALKIPVLAGSVGWVTLSAAVILVLTGFTGVTSVRSQHDNYMAMKRCADTLPRPLFFNNPFMGLPWMTPGNTPYVFSYVYYAERAMGRKFQYGGFGGLIAKGKFAAIVNSSRQKKIDGATLDHYSLVKRPQCSGLYVYMRH